MEVFAKEEEIYQHEMEADGVDPAILEEKLKIYRREQKLAYLFASQRAFIESFITLINCEDDGSSARQIDRRLLEAARIHLSRPR